MTLEWHGPEAKRRLQETMAIRLQAVAVYFVKQHSQRIGKSNPRPYKDSSKPGEYMRARTGKGQAGLLYQPHDISGVIAAGLRVRVGFDQGVHYMLTLELFRQRKGLLATLNDIRPQLQALARSKVSRRAQ